MKAVFRHFKQVYLWYTFQFVTVTGSHFMLENNNYLSKESGKAPVC